MADPALKLIPRKVLFGDPERMMVRLSPDGRWISFLALWEGVRNLWVAPVDAPNEAHFLTQERRRPIAMYHWSYDGRHILYLEDTDGDENWKIYAIGVEGGEPRLLTPPHGVQARMIHLSPRNPETIVIGLNDRDARFHDLYRLHLNSGTRELIFQNNEFAEFLFDDSLAVKLAVRFTPEGWVEALKHVDGGWQLFLRFSPEDNITSNLLGLDAEGRTLYLLDSRGRDTAALAAIDLDTGEEKVLAADERCDATEVLVHPLSRKVQAVCFEYERRVWQAVDPEVEKDLKNLKEGLDGDFWVLSRTLADDLWLIANESDQGGIDYYLYDRQSGDLKFLFPQSAALKQYKFAPMYPVKIQARDGLPLVSYLTLPPEEVEQGYRPKRPLPLVLFVHGGPWARDSWGFNPFHQWLANRGYAVLSVNFRGSTGFGKNFVNASNREWGGAMHDDLVDAVQWAISQRIADPQRIAIMGFSYGGYATLVGLTFTPDLFCCGVDICGPSNLITLLQNIPPYWLPGLPLLKKRVGDPDDPQDRDFLLSRSPLTHAHRITKPLLIVQGANDPRVKRSESDQIVQALREKGIPVTYVLYLDEGHGFRRWENRLSVNAIVEAFLAHVLGGRWEPFGTDLAGANFQVLEGMEYVPGLKEALGSS